MKKLVFVLFLMSVSFKVSAGGNQPASLVEQAVVNLMTYSEEEFSQVGQDALSGVEFYAPEILTKKIDQPGWYGWLEERFQKPQSIGAIRLCYRLIPFFEKHGQEGMLFGQETLAHHRFSALIDEFSKIKDTEKLLKTACALCILHEKNIFQGRGEHFPYMHGKFGQALCKVADDSRGFRHFLEQVTIICMNLENYFAKPSYRWRIFMALYMSPYKEDGYAVHAQKVADLLVRIRNSEKLLQAKKYMVFYEEDILMALLARNDLDVGEDVIIDTLEACVPKLIFSGIMDFEGRKQTISNCMAGVACSYLESSLPFDKMEEFTTQLIETLQSIKITLPDPGDYWIISGLIRNAKSCDHLNGYLEVMGRYRKLINDNPKYLERGVSFSVHLPRRETVLEKFFKIVEEETYPALVRVIMGASFWVPYHENFWLALFDNIDFLFSFYENNQGCGDFILLLSDFALENSDFKVNLEKVVQSQDQTFLEAKTNEGRCERIAEFFD